MRAGAEGRYWGYRGVNVKGFASMLVGAGVCLLTVNSPILQGPISKALAGSDLTWILGLPVAGACYYALARNDVRATADVPASHLREALALTEVAAIHEGFAPHHGATMPAPALPGPEATDA